MSSKILGACMVLAMAGACGGRAPASGASSDVQTRPVGGNRDVLTETELHDPSRSAESVLDVVRSLRPWFLTQRGKNSHSDNEAGKVHVSVDYGRIVPLEELANMHAGSVIEVRYLSPAAAMQKFGGAAREGSVILVRTIPR